MSDSTQLPAGWYDDPAGSGGHRWWAGTQWTDEVRARPPEPFAPPEPTPFTAPAVQDYQPMSYTSTSFPAAAPSEYRYAGRVDVDNTKGWLSLAAGVGSLVLLAVTSFAGVILIGTFTAVVFGITWGARALSMRKRGMATLLAVPVVGIILSALTVVLFLGGLLATALGAAVMSSDFVQQQQQQSFPENPELQRMYDTAYDLQSQLTDELRSGTLPETLTADNKGEIRLDGELLAILDAGQVFTYSLLDRGQHYEFAIYGTVLGERVQYNSQTGNLVAVCFETDDTCGF